MLPLNELDDDILFIISSYINNDPYILHKLILINDQNISKFFNVNIHMLKSSVENYIFLEINNNISTVLMLIYDSLRDGDDDEYIISLKELLNTYESSSYQSSTEIYIRNIKKYILLKNNNIYESSDDEEIKINVTI
jgi:hypothetical protein